MKFLEQTGEDVQAILVREIANIALKKAFGRRTSSGWETRHCFKSEFELRGIDRPGEIIKKKHILPTSNPYDWERIGEISDDGTKIAVYGEYIKGAQIYSELFESMTGNSVDVIVNSRGSLETKLEAA